MGCPDGRRGWHVVGAAGKPQSGGCPAAKAPAKDGTPGDTRSQAPGWGTDRVRAIDKGYGLGNWRRGSFEQELEPLTRYLSGPRSLAGPRDAAESPESGAGAEAGGGA